MSHAGYVPLLAVTALSCTSLPEQHARVSRRMGNPPVVVRYITENTDHPDWCGWIGWDGKRPSVAYTRRANKRTVLHENCHIRMQHHRLIEKMSEAEMHAEVSECMKWYGK